MLCRLSGARFSALSGSWARTQLGGAALQQVIGQTNLTLRSIVLITASIFPFNICFATLRVYPLTV